VRIKPSRLRDIKILAAVLIFISAYQYVTDGAVTWPRAVYNEVTSYLDRPQAGWREATDAINDAVAKLLPSCDRSTQERFLQILTDHIRKADQVQA